MKRNKELPVTLLTNDNNLSSKARANNVPTLASNKPNQEPLSSEFLIRQAIHGAVPMDTTFIRPKEGTDTCMLDLSGTPSDRLKFLPGLEGSRHAPRNDDKARNSKIRIDLETGAVVLVKNADDPSATGAPQAENGFHTVIEGVEEHPNGIHQRNSNTYADIMALQRDSKDAEEMDWE